MGNISRVWSHIQKSLFPFLEEYAGPLNEREKKLAAVLELAGIEKFIPPRWWHMGRPPKDRCALGKAFVAKAVYNCAKNSDLIALLESSPNLRLICGWETPGQVPSESTFSRAFRDFSEMGLAKKAHEALIAKYEAQRLVGHVSRDASDIPVAEKPSPKPKEVKIAKPKGRATASPKSRPGCKGKVP